MNFTLIKQNYDVICREIGRGQEPISELRKVIEFLNLLIVQEDSTSGADFNPCIFAKESTKESPIFTQKEVKFILEEMSVGLIRRMCKEQSDSDQYLEVCGQVLEAYLRLLIVSLKQEYFNQEFLLAVRFIFDFECKLHKINFQIPDNIIQRMYTKGGGQMWRTELKEGDYVDGVLHNFDRAGQIKCQGWSRAIIKSVDGDTLFLNYYQDFLTTSRAIDRWSVELDKFESQTTEIQKWKDSLKVDDTVDAQDDYGKWIRSTIIEIKECKEGDNTFPIALIGFRVYNREGKREDAIGNFDGYIDKFDEQIPLYSPKIAKLLSKTGINSNEDYEIDEELDDVISTSDGFSRVWAVPRRKVCQSSEYIRLLNLFCEEGGLDLLYSTVEKGTLSEKPNEFNLSMLACLISTASLPTRIYHKQVVKDYIVNLVQICKQRLLSAPDRALRDLRREHIEAIIKAADFLSIRINNKQEREKDTEIFRLEVAFLCLQSSYLERKIQGIQDLTSIIKNYRIMSQGQLTGKFLVDWMDEKGVISQLLDPKRTHLQIVQRCEEVLRLLIQESALTQPILKQFWDLTKTDNRVEAFKIIQSASFNFQQQHLDFIFEQMSNTQIEKLDLEDLNCLSELANHARDRDTDFQDKVAGFFLKLIVNENKNLELQLLSITKYTELVRYWLLEKKQEIFVNLVDQLKKSTTSTTPILKLLRGLIKEQADKNFSNTQISTSVGSYPSLTSNNQQIDPQNDEQQTEFSLQSIVSNLITEMKLPEVLLENLRQYLALTKEHQTKTNNEITDRRKLFVGASLFSHQEEVEQRLDFLKFIAGQSEGFVVSRKELGVIYDLLVTQAVVDSDQQEFLLWCKSSCQTQTTRFSVLDLEQVGTFVTDKIAEGYLNVKELPKVGLEFLLLYFISLNEKAQKLERVKEKQQTSTYYGSNQNNQGNWVTSYSWSGNNSTTYKPKEDKTKLIEEIPQVILLSPPEELLKIDLIWTLVLECRKPEVSAQVSEFLIKINLSQVKDGLFSKTEILSSLVHQCMKKLQEQKDENTQIKIIGLLKSLILETDGDGINNMVPHGALQKGEPLSPLVIKNKINLRGGELSVLVYTNTTLSELKRSIAQALDFSSRYLQLNLTVGYSEKRFKDPDNGKTMKALGITGGETFWARKALPEDTVPNAALTNQDGTLTRQSQRIFEQWYEMFRDEEGSWIRESAEKFLLSCCGEPPGPQDTRITGLFNQYDRDQDGRIQIEEFLEFYQIASSSIQKQSTVRDNLKSFNVRMDLKKWSELDFETSDSMQLAPRHFISENGDTFSQLMNLLDKGSYAVKKEVWELVQMLTTNEQFYRQVLSLDIARNSENQVEWDKFFDTSSSFKLLYTLQIVQAVLEDGQTKSSRAVALNANDFPTSRVFNYKDRPELALTNDEEGSQEIKDKKEENSKIDELRSQWTKKFLLQGGLSYLLEEFMNPKNNKVSDGQLEFAAFQMQLLRTFINLELNMMGTSNSQFLEKLDYSALQTQIVSTISSTLAKDQQMVFEDRLLISDAISLWVSCVQSKPNLFLEFIASTNKQEGQNFFISGLLMSTQNQVREDFKKAVIELTSMPDKLTENDETCLSYFLTALSQNFEKVSQFQCQQYIQVFCHLLDQLIKVQEQSKNFKQAFDPEILLAQLISQIGMENERIQNQKRQSEGLSLPQESSKAGDTKQESSQQSSLFMGLITLASKVLDLSSESDTQNKSSSGGKNQKQLEGLVDEIFTRFLFHSAFNSPDEDSQTLMMSQVIQSKKRQTSVPLSLESKGAAFKLLQGLFRRNISLLQYFIKNSLIPLLVSIGRSDAWDYQPAVEGNDKQDFVGLRNLGCICYMNSMLQQFFMIPALRYNLLAVDDQKPPNNQIYKNQLVDDNVLHQIQQLMANLELSERSDYNPWQFCFAFKEFDGTPTNIGEQKDSQEFLNLIFDRLENSLKETSRKYLLQSVFGGQTCSQLICPSCGKCKNRLEDFYNLSLTVKDIKGVYESLAKLIEGETISDYECSGCKKKVEVGKRTLIASGPNVLIVHLQRIIFNFDTFQNDKINSHFEFPRLLDISPYSYYKVMEKEQRLSNQNQEKKDDKNGDEEEVQNKDDEENKKEEKKEEEENPVPKEDDCFLYKLVGVTVHSGSAHAGHYWSLISTNRESTEEVTEDWEQAEGERWMEFNDSSVREFQASKLKDECYGGDGASSSGFGLSAFDSWGMSGSTYGKSGYMLFYEKIKKKPIRIVKEAAQEGKEEVIEEVPFQSLVRHEDTPNRVFSKVLEENKRFGFENDIYSPNFFEFLLSVQKTVLANFADSQDQLDEQEMHLIKQTLHIGTKATLDIVARAYNNAKVDEFVYVLAQLIKKGNLYEEFMQNQFDQDGFNYLFCCILECPDQRSRQAISMLLKYVLVHLKIKEKDYLFEPEDYEVEGDDGQVMIMQRHKSLSARFIVRGVELFNSFVAKNWNKLEFFMDLLYTFGSADIEDVEKYLDLNNTPLIESKQFKALADYSKEGVKIGLEFYAKLGFVGKACDFMLGKKSPMYRVDEKRPELGSYYQQPILTQLARLITNIVSIEEINNQFPLYQQEKDMLMDPQLLKVFFGSEFSSKHFGKSVANLCKDNMKLSRKIAKVFLRTLEKAQDEQTRYYLKALKPFLLINDSLKLLRLEWIFGVPDLIFRKVYGETKERYGVELIDRVNEEHLNYLTPILPLASSNALLQQIIKCKGTTYNSTCISCLKQLLGLMKKDEIICKFLYNQQPVYYQHARYIDWFKEYLLEQLQDQTRNHYNTGSSNISKLHLTTKALAHLEALKPKFEKFEADQLENMKNIIREGKEFIGLQDDWITASSISKEKSTETLIHFPPQLILGKQAGLDIRILKEFNDNPFVTVTLFEYETEYAYSAPTNEFNLAIPQLSRRLNSYHQQSYYQMKKEQLAQQKNAQEEKDGNKNQEEEGSSAADEDSDNQGQSNNQSSEKKPRDEEIVTEARSWITSKKQGFIFFRVQIENKLPSQEVKVWYRLSHASESDPSKASGLNAYLPHSLRKVTLNPKAKKFTEFVIKIDPTKEFFLEDLQDLKLEIEVTRKQDSQQNTRVQSTQINSSSTNNFLSAGNTNEVHYQYAVVGDDDQEDEEEEQDGGTGTVTGYANLRMYGEYSENVTNLRMYGSYPEGAAQEENLVNLLLQPQDGQKSVDADKNSDDSTKPQYYEGWKDEALDKEPLVKCYNCTNLNLATAFQCSACGEYNGGEV